jgi:apolipoprotein N-acyltransferase
MQMCALAGDLDRGLWKRAIALPATRWFAPSCLLFSGVAQAAISPPLSWVVLHPLSWLPALWVISRLDGRRALLAGWLVGASANAAIFYWIVHTVGSFSNLPTAVGVGVLGLFSLAFGFYCAVFAWGFAAVRRAAGRYWPFGVAAWFSICEFVNPQLFPYYQGVAWYQLPSVFLVVSLTGVAGVTFLVISANAIALQALEWLRSREAGRALVINLAILGTLVLSACAWSAYRLTLIERAEAKTEPFRVAIVQPNYGVRRHAALSAKPEGIARDLVDLSRAANREQGPLDVVVWPEKVLVRSPQHTINQAVLEFVHDTGIEVWTGGDHKERAPSGGSHLHNSAFRVDPEGRIDRRYDKIILLPFGEFMPLLDVFPVLGKIRGVGRFAPGSELFVYDSDRARFVFLICYEAIRSELVGQGVSDGIDLLVNLTFDGWFGDTSEPSEHLMLAAVQSALYGVPLVRSTTTGISAVVDARGIITARTGLFTRETLVRDVKPMQVASPYASLGEWFAWSCGLASAGLLLRSRLRRSAASGTA